MANGVKEVTNSISVQIPQHFNSNSISIQCIVQHRFDFLFFIKIFFNRNVSLVQWVIFIGQKEVTFIRAFVQDSALVKI